MKFSGSPVLPAAHPTPIVKPYTPAAAYVALYPELCAVARGCGYALAVHGSLGRDFDLIAVPWTPEAVSDAELVEALRSFCGGRVFEAKSETDGTVGPNPTAKPHGRMAWSLHVIHPATIKAPYLDISVMPRIHLKP